jgi:hypothetical protein
METNPGVLVPTDASPETQEMFKKAKYLDMHKIFMTTTRTTKTTTTTTNIYKNVGVETGKKSVLLHHAPVFPMAVFHGVSSGGPMTKILNSPLEQPTLVWGWLLGQQEVGCPQGIES